MPIKKAKLLGKDINVLSISTTPINNRIVGGIAIIITLIKSDLFFLIENLETKYVNRAKAHIEKILLKLKPKKEKYFEPKKAIKMVNNEDKVNKSMCIMRELKER